MITDQKANQYIKEVAQMLPELNIEVNVNSYNDMKEYEHKMNDGFWRTIFNAFD